LHGGGEDERGWATQGKTDLILDNLIAEKKARPMLVVVPDGNVDMPSFGEHCQTMLSKFDEMNIKYIYNEYPGGYTWPVWRNNLYKIAPLLFK
jgi:enterochelin esterase-like enzyme